MNVPRPQLGSLNFTNGKVFFVLAFVLLIICSAVRRDPPGHDRTRARRDAGSELAAVSIGTNLAKLKVTVFVVAAALAGVGGALYGSLQGTVSPNDFNSLLSLVFMVVVVTTGVYTVQGAIQAGMAYVILYQVLDYLPSQWRNLFPILFGLGRDHLRAPPGGRRGMAEAAREVETVVSWARARGNWPADMALVEATGISKRYGGIVALDNVSSSLDHGEAVGLVGPNGAGKTTLFDCLNGMHALRHGGDRLSMGAESTVCPSISGPPRHRAHLPEPRAVLRHERRASTSWLPSGSTGPTAGSRRT